MKLLSFCLFSTALIGATNCAMAENSNKVNIWNWSYNIGEHTVADFVNDTKLDVKYVEYDSNEQQEAILLSGKSGYDAAIVVSYYVPRLAKSGALQKIDHSKIPNWVKLNHERLELLGTIDPGNEYAYPYIEISIGIGYNKTKIEQIFGKDYKVDSWDFLLNPENSAKLKKCGIAIIDSPIEVISAVQHYLGKDPISENAKDFEEARKLLTGLAKNTAYFQSNRYVNDLASGEICATIGYSGDIIQARHLAQQAGITDEIEYVVPKEGSIMWFDSWTIPLGAENLDNAYTWFNWLQDPKNATKLSDEIGYVMPIDESMANLSDELRANSSILLSKEKLKTMYFMQSTPAKTSRITNKVWNSMKTDSGKTEEEDGSWD